MSNRDDFLKNGLQFIVLLFQRSLGEYKIIKATKYVGKRGISCFGFKLHCFLLFNKGKRNQCFSLSLPFHLNAITAQSSSSSIDFSGLET